MLITWCNIKRLLLIVLQTVLLLSSNLNGGEVAQIVCSDPQGLTITFQITRELSNLDELKTLTIDPGNLITISSVDSQAVLKNVVVSNDGFGLKRFISLGFAEALLIPVADMTLDMKVGELSGFYSTPQQVEISGQSMVDHIDKKVIAPNQFLCEESMKSSTTNNNGESDEPTAPSTI